MLWTRQGRLRGGGKPIASMRENNNDQCQGICEQRDAIDYGGVTKRFVGLIYQSDSSCSVNLSDRFTDCQAVLLCQSVGQIHRLPSRFALSICRAD